MQKNEIILIVIGLGLIAGSYYIYATRNPAPDTGSQVEQDFGETMSNWI